MPQYLISFNAEWVPDLTEEQILDSARSIDPVIDEAIAAGVWVFGGGLDDKSAVFSVDPNGGKPKFTDGPYAETKEHFGGFSVVDVPDDEQARHWAAKIAVGCGWPMQVQQLGTPPKVS